MLFVIDGTLQVRRLSDLNTIIQSKPLQSANDDSTIALVGDHLYVTVRADMHVFKVDLEAQFPLINLLKHYKTKDCVNVMIRCPDMLLLGENVGYL